MVKTPFGRHPGPKHAKIVKKLRHRRRMAERKLREAAQTEISDTLSYEVSTARTPSPSHLDQQCQQMNAIKAPSPCVSTAELSEPRGDKDQIRIFYPSELSSVYSTSSEDEGEAPGQLVFECDQRVPGLTICVRCRQPSETTNGNSNDRGGTRQSVSELSVHKSHAASLTAPSRLAATFIAEADRPQHVDEDTDRYLAHHFTPSLLNITTADEPTQDTRSEDFVKLRNLLSSDTQVTASESPRTVDFAKFEDILSSDSSETTVVFNNSSEVSEASLHLTTLFNNKTTAEGAGTSCETTTMGLRTLFDEEDHQNLKSTPSTFGLNTLFNAVHGKDTDNATTLSRLTSPYATTILTSYGSSSHPRSPTQKSCCYCPMCNKSAADMPAVTASSSLLGNLFASSSAIHDDDHLLTEKERKKVLIAKDLAAYLNSDDERTHPKSTSLSTFVQQIEVLFDNYRAAVRMIEDLKAEKEQHQ